MLTFKNRGCIDLDLINSCADNRGTCAYIRKTYEVYVIKPVTKMTVHR